MSHLHTCGLKIFWFLQQDQCNQTLWHLLPNQSLANLLSLYRLFRLANCMYTSCYIICFSISFAGRIFVGTLTMLAHRVTGRFHVDDERTFYIEDFNYDGFGPGGSSEKHCLNIRTAAVFSTQCVCFWSPLHPPPLYCSLSLSLSHIPPSPSSLYYIQSPQMPSITTTVMMMASLGIQEVEQYCEWQLAMKHIA